MSLSERVIESIKNFIGNKMLVSEDTGTGGMAGFNSPSILSNQPVRRKLDLFGNPVKKAKKKKKNKKKQESLELFVKNSILNENKLLSEDMILQDEDDSEDNEIKNNKEKQPEQNEIIYNELNDFLYRIGMSQLPDVYNKIFVPYFQYIKSRFDIKAQGHLQLIDAYAFFDRQTVALLQGYKNHIPEESVQALQNIIEINKQIDLSIQKFISNIDIKEIAEDEKSEVYKTKILDNAKEIISLFNVVLSPIENDLQGMLKQVDISLNTIAFQNSNYYKSLNDLFLATQKIFLADQFNVILQTFKTNEKIFYGTWLFSFLQKQLNGLTPQPYESIHNPTKDINEIQQNIKNDIKNNSTKLNNIYKQFGDIFTKVANIFPEYDNTLIKFCHGLKFTNIIKNNNVIDKKRIKQIITGSDPGFFNLHYDKIAIAVINEILKTIKDKQSEKEKESKNKEKKSEEPGNVEEYVEYYLGFKDSKLPEEYRKLLMLMSENQLRWDEEKNIISRIGNITEKHDIKITLLKALQGDNSLITLIQNWAAMEYPDELVLYGANKYSFENIIHKMKTLHKMKDEKNEGSISDEDTYAGVGSLYEILSNQKLNGDQNGHDLRWRPSQESSVIINDLDKDEFCNGLFDEPESFWRKIFFTNSFFKNKVYTNNGKEDAKDLNDIVNKNDIEVAKMRIGKDELKENKKNFRTNLVEQILDTKLDVNQQNALGVTTFKNVINSYSDKDIKNNAEDKNGVKKVDMIGQIVYDMFDDFIDNYGEQYNLPRNLSRDKKAQFFAEKMLENTKDKEYGKSDVKNLTSYLNNFFGMYNPEYRKSHGNKTSGDAISDIMKTLQQFIK
jgi:hypothetical protein